MKTKILLSSFLLLSIGTSIPIENVNIDALYNINSIYLTETQQMLVYNSYKDTPLAELMDACSKDDIEKVRTLIRSKINVNLQAPLIIFQGKTPLCIAVQNGNFELVKLLIEEGEANVNLPQRVYLQSPLMYAAESVRGLPVVWENTELHGRFIDSSKGGELLKVFSFLLNAGANVHQKDYKGRTAHTYALQCLDLHPSPDSRLITGEIISSLAYKASLTSCLRSLTRLIK